MKITKHILSALILIIIPIAASAQGLVDPEILTGETSKFGQEAGFTDISIGAVVASIIKTVLGFLALIFLVLTIMAGFKWMNAGGDEKKVEEAQASLKSAVIGLVVVLSAYTITYFVFKALPFSGGGAIMPQATNS